RQAAALGPRPFIRFEDGQALSFGDLDAWTDRLAGSLAALGVGAGERVLGLIGNRAEALGLLLAAAKLGAVWVPINIGLRGALPQPRLDTAEPGVVALGAALAATRRDVRPGPVRPAAVVAVGDPAPPTPACWAGARRLAFAELQSLPAPRDLALATPAPSDIAMIMYTTRTTGPSKGVLMPHAHCYLLGIGTPDAHSHCPYDCSVHW